MLKKSHELSRSEAEGDQMSFRSQSPKTRTLQRLTVDMVRKPGEGSADPGPCLPAPSQSPRHGEGGAGNGEEPPMERPLREWLDRVGGRHSGYCDRRGAAAQEVTARDRAVVLQLLFGAPRFQFDGWSAVAGAADTASHAESDRATFRVAAIREHTMGNDSHPFTLY